MLSIDPSGAGAWILGDEDELQLRSSASIVKGSEGHDSDTPVSTATDFAILHRIPLHGPNSTANPPLFLSMLEAVRLDTISHAMSSDNILVVVGKTNETQHPFVYLFNTASSQQVGYVDLIPPSTFNDTNTCLGANARDFALMPTRAHQPFDTDAEPPPASKAESDAVETQPPLLWIRCDRMIFAIGFQATTPPSSSSQEEEDGGGGGSETPTNPTVANQALAVMRADYLKSSEPLEMQGITPDTKELLVRVQTSTSDRLTQILRLSVSASSPSTESSAPSPPVVVMSSIVDSSANTSHSVVSVTVVPTSSSPQFLYQFVDDAVVGESKLTSNTIELLSTSDSEQSPSDSTPIWRFSSPARSLPSLVNDYHSKPVVFRGVVREEIEAESENEEDPPGENKPDDVKPSETKVNEEEIETVIWVERLVHDMAPSSSNVTYRFPIIHAFNFTDGTLMRSLDLNDDTALLTHFMNPLIIATPGVGCEPIEALSDLTIVFDCLAIFNRLIVIDWKDSRWQLPTPQAGPNGPDTTGTSTGGSSGEGGGLTGSTNPSTSDTGSTNPGKDDNTAAGAETSTNGSTGENSSSSSGSSSSSSSSSSGSGVDLSSSSSTGPSNTTALADGDDDNASSTIIPPSLRSSIIALVVIFGLLLGAIGVVVLVRWVKRDPAGGQHQPLGTEPRLGAGIMLDGTLDPEW